MKEYKQSLPLRGSKYFLYVGNAYPHKNLERAIKAAIDLKVLFYIVSSRNVFTKRLEEVIEKLNGKEYVKLLGFVDDEKLSGLYRNAVGFIYPSLMEGFGLPGLEAMKNGTLVAASNMPVFKEVYKENAIYFDPIDQRSIEKTLEQTINMSMAEREKRIKKAKEFIKRYSWEKMTRETLGVYKQCYNKS